ncbi:dual specificity tyrosine-phosphorylation-regulated kinase 2/3/4, partial [Phenoliferia sp. Uapishka_3]
METGPQPRPRRRSSRTGALDEERTSSTSSAAGSPKPFPKAPIGSASSTSWEDHHASTSTLAPRPPASPSSALSPLYHLDSPAVHDPIQWDSQSPSSAAFASPRQTANAPSAQLTPRSPNSATRPSPGMSSFQFPSVPSYATSSPRQSSSPSHPAVTPSTTSTPNVTPRPPRTSSNPPSPAQSSSSAMSSSPYASARKKAPPPLELRAWELDGSRRIVRAQSSETSQTSTSESRVDTSYDPSDAPRRRQPSATSLPTTAAPLPNSTSEERDTLSQMFSFRSSPLLELHVPEPSPSDPSPADPEADDEPERTSQTPSSGTGTLSSSASFNYGSSGYGAARQHYGSGLGLGLPFSMSAAANLSSMAPVSPTARSSTSNTPGASADSDYYGTPATPSTPHGERNRSSTSGVESPVTDRSKLIGLGELATPRWTSGVLERRWGTPAPEESNKGKNAVQEDTTDEYDFLESYNGEREIVPTSHVALSDVASPTIARPATHQPASLFSTMATSASSTSLFNSTTTGLINFKNEPAFFPSVSPLDASSRQPIQRPSSSYSLGAISITEELEAPSESKVETLKDSQDGSDSDRKYNPLPSRKSVGAAVSAPNTAAGSAWTVTPGSEPSVGGLGFEYDVTNGGAAALAAATAALDMTHRRTSSASTSSRRSSSGGPTSSDGKPRTHLRRQSASKSGFSHLPPSPAASSATHPQTTPGPPVPLPTSPTPPHSATARTPDLARLSHRSSFHSHHSSPSIIAASILRQTREPEYEGVDMDEVAAHDTGTAEALRKLDGLTSPRISRGSSGPVPTLPRSRTSSRETSTPGREEARVRRRTRSIGGSTAGLPRDAEHIALGESTSLTSSVRSLNPSTSSSPNHPNPTSPAAYAHPFAYPASRPATKSPVSPQMVKPVSVPRPGSSGTNDVPFPGAPAFKRGSSSSASLTAGTSTSASGSRDSTSGTSLSGSSFATSAARSASSKNRRGSVSSDVSSTPSLGDAAEGTEGETIQYIPPVPPLPKDWESYRPSTGGTSISSVQNSPRFEAARRPSDSSSFNDAALLSPRSADMEAALSSSSGTAKTPTRKWSISSAFKSKSPKPTSIKESTSYTDLASAAGRPRDSSSSNFGSELMYTRRLAASTNDIVGLTTVSSRDSQERESTSSKVRNTFRGDKTSSILSRPRTASMTSNSTTRTASTSQAAPPTVVTTSPGRSRSSLLSPRRTPSGIPFFSRKSSTGSVVAKTPSPTPGKTEPSEEKPSSGRKSILGLNFLRSTASRRDKEKVPASPSLKRATMSNVPVAKDSEPRQVDEWGRRASVGASKSGSLMTRKRGKTLNSAEDGPADAQPLSLPPMQMSALSATTVRRVDSLNSSISSMAGVAAKQTSGSSRIQPPASKTNKLQESVKGNLPTIAGSPSTHTFPLTQSRQQPSRSSDSTTPPPKSHTPTKIPRLYQRPAPGSPKLTPRASDSSINKSYSPTASTTSQASRRLSHYSTTPDAAGSLSSASNNVSLSENDSSSEFGVINREPGLSQGEKTLSTRRRLDSEPSGIPRSRSTAAGMSFPTRAPLESSVTTSVSSRTSTGATALPRASRRKSLMAGEDAKALAASALASPRGISAVSRTPAAPAPLHRGLSESTPSTSSTPAGLPLPRRPLSKTGDSMTTSASTRRTSAMSSTTLDTLASSRSSRSISSKMAIPSRMSKASGSSALAPATSDTGSGRSSASSQNVTEEQLRGDEEMTAYVRRQQAKKLAAGMSSDTIRKMFEFPDPTEPLPSLQSRDAISLYGRCLSEYEKEEIRDYDDIYFVGPSCDKKPATKENTTNNFGFDDERGDYLLVPHDHIRFRYEVFDVLGKGSFGQVLQCRDHKTGEMVAIKIIRNKKRFHHQALVEIKVLENLVKWDPDEKHYVIRMVDSFTFRGHLCIVTELLSINLYELVKANSFAGFSTILIRRFTMQILGSLALLRHQRVVHCDLKPENILLKHPAKSAIKVIDFGSSCFENEKVYTYIQSRFYRSPEVILGMNYHMAIDMWSLGCIIAEMFTGYPIFPGENEQEQLACIMEVMGLPEKYLVDRSSRKRLFFDSTGAPRPVVNSKGRRRRPGTKTLAQVLKSDDELFVDFIAKCLTWDPDRRLKPEPALRHPWIVAARARANSPTIPIRTGRSSTAASVLSSGSSSVSSSNISSPRRKVGSSTTASMATPSHSHHSSTAGAATAPVVRTRTSSTATSVPRLTSKGSLGLSTSSRYQVKS